MYVIHSNCGDNSAALIQWAHERGLRDVTVCYVETGWAGVGWEARVDACAQLSQSCGFRFERLRPRADFARLMVIRDGFPAGRYQWCSLQLKGITLLQWLDQHDPAVRTTVLYGKRQADSSQIDLIHEYIEQSEHHGERRVWHPLYDMTTEARDALLARAGIPLLGHASHQCLPCINSPWATVAEMEEADVAKTEELEEELGAYLYAARVVTGEADIRNVIRRIRAGEDLGALPRPLLLKARRIRAGEDLGDADIRFGCSAAFGCGE